jgi:hypothetical protein
MISKVTNKIPSCGNKFMNWESTEEIGKSARGKLRLFTNPELLVIEEAPL